MIAANLTSSLKGLPIHNRSLSCPREQAYAALEQDACVV